MELNVEQNTVKRCASCGWDHDDVEYDFSRPDAISFRCLMTRDKVILVSDGTIKTIPKRYS